MAYASGSGGGAGWTTAGVMDTMDIMSLPLTYEEEPAVRAVNKPARENVIYAPWEGPDAYIPGELQQA